MVHGIDPLTGEDVGPLYASIPLDEITREEGRTQAQDKLRDLLDRHPEANVSYSEYDDNGQVVA